jgi:hypothetical protein
MNVRNLALTIIHTIAITLLVVGLGTATAQATPPAQPNLYEFTGKREKITYSHQLHGSRWATLAPCLIT